MKMPLFRRYLPLTASLLLLVFLAGFVAKFTHTALFYQLSLLLMEACLLLNLLVLTLSAGQTIWQKLTGNAGQ